MEKIVTYLSTQGYAVVWLILAVVALRFFLQKAPKWTRYILWALVAVRLCCPLTLESVFSLVPYRASPARQTLTAGDFSGVVTVESSADTSDISSAAPGVKPLKEEAESSGLALLGWGWLGGMSVMLAYSAVSYGKLKRRVRAAVHLEGKVWLGDEVYTPFVLGVFRPRIFLPSGMEPPQRDYVLAHENMHLRHLDHWWKMAGFCLLAVYWFHPLVWLAYVLFCRDMELACDESVVRDYDMARKKAYAEVLLACSIRSGGIAACPVAFGEVGVKARVRAVLHYKKPGFWILLAALLLCAAAAVCFLTNPKRRLVLPENPLVFRTEVTEEYQALLYGEKYYVPYAAVGPSAIGDCIGYCDTVDGETTYRDYICTFPGYAPQDWIVSVMGLGNCDEAMLYREIHVTELPEDIYNEYPWNGIAGDVDTDIQTNGTDWSHEDDLRSAMGVVDIVDMRKIWGERVDGVRLTLEDVIRLSAKSWELNWADFDGYAYLDTGSGLIIHVYPIDQYFSLWVGGGGGSAPMYIYLQENATEERIDIREQEVETFIAQHGGQEPERAVRLPLAEMAADGNTVRLGEMDAEFIFELVRDVQWQDGTTDCITSYSLAVGEITLQYHADCGTFNDPANNRHFTLPAEQTEDVNIRLARYLRQSMPIESVSKPGGVIFN